MPKESIVETIAVTLKLKPAQIKTADVHAKIPALKRMVEKYEKEAVAAEGASLANRARAFSPDTPAAERAQLMRQSTMDAQRAKMHATCAGTFLTQLGNFTSLETTMQIADEMKEVGLINSDASAMDWQNAMDTMQDEIQQMIATSQKLGDVMGSVLADSPTGGTDLVEELNQLFAKYEAETDPVKKEEIRKTIEAKSDAQLV